MKSVLITGAAQGFGRALFDLYIKKGWLVFPLVRKANDADELKNIAPQRCFPILADLRDKDLEEKIAETLSTKTDSLDYLINNAGYVRKIIGILPITQEDLSEHLTTNLIGAWNCAKAAFPFLEKSNQGIIINISSRRGTFSFNTATPFNRANPYKISKAALNMLTLLMDQEFSEHGIRVLPVHPGRLKTRVAPPDADTLPEVAAQKLYDWINKIDSSIPCKLYDVVEEKFIDW